MDMSVNQIGRRIPVKQREKRLKAAVSNILRIAVSGRRGMCENQIYAACPAELPEKFSDAPFHLPLGVLVWAAAVHPRPAKVWRP